MATRSEKAKLYNQLRSQGFSEGDAITQAGITDSDLDNYDFVINEAGSPDPSAIDYNPQYGQMEPFDIGFGSGTDRAEINDAEPYTPRTIKPTQRAESTTANQPKEDNTSIQPLSTDPNVVITRTTTTTTTQNVQTSGGGTRTRTAGVYEDGPQGAALRQKEQEVAQQRQDLIAEKRAQGASFREVVNDPEVVQLSQERDQLREEINQQRVEVTPPTDTFVEAPESNITTVTQQKTIEREQAEQKAKQAEQDKNPQDPAGQAEGVEKTGRIVDEDERERLVGQDLGPEDEPGQGGAIQSSENTSATDEARQTANATQSNAQKNLDSTTQQPVSSVRGSASTNTAITTKQNPLRQYASFAYHVELYILPLRKLNQISTGGTWTKTSNDLLISNSGTASYDNFVQVGRNPAFQNSQYHIDNINISSLIGFSGRNRNTNVTELSFTIYEPYGVSLIENLILANSTLGEGNYIAQPYMLSVSFLGYDDNGAEITDGVQTKNIPIRITDMRFNIDKTGSNYEITAIPYHHQGYDTIRNTIPFNVVITAGNVESFFNAKVDVINTITVERGDFAGRQTRTENVKKTSNFDGLAAALNNFEQQKVTNGYQYIADEYAFEFDKDLGEARFTLADLLNIEEEKVPMARNNIEDLRNSIDPSISYSEAQKSFVIRQGTSITELINLIVRRGTYMTNQIDTTKENTSEPLQWWKIVPRIELLGYDESRKAYAKRVTFYVKRVELNGRNIDGVGKKMPESVHKSYNYIYTGQNEDIINLNLQFDASYYQARSLVQNFAQSQPYVPQGTDRNTSKNTVMPVPVHFHNSYETDAIVGDIENVKLAGDITRQILNNSVDMLELSLEILGDPDYIDTTNYRMPAVDNDFSKSIYLPDGGINYNARETYLELTLKTPTDYDPQTGEMNVTNAKNSVLVSGKYRVLEVQSTLSAGQFTQNISAVKLTAPENNLLSDAQVSDQLAGGILNSAVSDSIGKGLAGDYSLPKTNIGGVAGSPLPGLGGAGFNPDLNPTAQFGGTGGVGDNLGEVSNTARFAELQNLADEPPGSGLRPGAGAISRGLFNVSGDGNSTFQSFPLNGAPSAGRVFAPGDVKPGVGVVTQQIIETPGPTAVGVDADQGTVNQTGVTVISRDGRLISRQPLPGADDE